MPVRSEGSEMGKQSSAKKTFNAKSKSIGPGGAWTMMAIPFSVEKEWGSRARVSVRFAINGTEFRTSIFPDGSGRHRVMINKAMQQAGAAPGKSVRVEITQDTEPRALTIPPDFKKAIAKSSKAAKVFASFAPSHRRAYVDWIMQAKREETRTARIKNAIEMIAAGKKRM
jgi:hypothetical protein